MAVAAALAAAAGVPGAATRKLQTSGDEPHYLLTALSIGEDGDLDVGDETDAGRYRPFHDAGLLSQAARRPDGTMLVPHDPLLPALLAVPMRVGGWVAAKLTLGATAGLLAALMLWTAVRRLGVPLATATLVTAVFGLSAPLAVYGHQVYPEVPAALAVTAAVAALTGPLRAGGLAAAGSAVVALPWLSVKYVPVAAVLAGVGLARLVRRGDRRTAGTFAAALGLAGAAYVAAHLAWYGGLTVYASGAFFADHGGEFAVVGTRPNYLGRARRLVGLLVDREFGLAAWQPAWLLAVPASAALLRRRPPGWAALAAPAAVGWLVATFVALTMHGWWFPGRQVVVVLPAAVLTVAWWAGQSRGRLAVAGAAGATGAATYLLLAWEAAQPGGNWIIDFPATANPWYRLWRLVLPDYRAVTSSTWVLHGLWVVVVAALVAWGWRGASGRGGRLRPRPRRGTGLGVGAGVRTRMRPGRAPRPGRRTGPGVRPRR